MTSRMQLLAAALFLTATMTPPLWGGESDLRLRIGGPCSASATIPLEMFDHTRFDRLLRAYVDDRGRVCYSEWESNCADVQSLLLYLHELGHADMGAAASGEARLALGINAYNALTLWGILQEYPVPSIQLLNKNGGDYKIFDDLKVWLGGSYMSLNQIENEMLRPLGDPRIHFALVCAARGCPRLRNEAYRPEFIDLQLTDNAVHFFSSRERFRLSRHGNKVLVSPILKWYGEDFGADPNQLMATIFSWLPAEDRQWLATHPGWTLDYLGYDWGLNDRCPTFSVAAGRIPFDIAQHWGPLVRRLMPKKVPDEDG